MRPKKKTWRQAKEEALKSVPSRCPYCLEAYPEPQIDLPRIEFLSPDEHKRRHIGLGHDS
jgi:hypothetical protein